MKKLTTIILLALTTSVFSQKKKDKQRIDALEQQVTQLQNDMGLMEKEIKKLSSLNKTPKTNGPNNEILNEGPKAIITFKNSEYDFGTINQNDIVAYTYEFTNTGKVPLIIENASASCGCTVPDWPKGPVAPGETSQINVKFDSKGKKGIQNKQITIRANTNPNFTKVSLKGNVLVPTDLSPLLTPKQDNHDGHNH